MDFKSNQPIYIQIIEFCFQKIILKEWISEERILSVRELAILLQVNPNTVMRAFEQMQSENIIYLKRGTGYFVSEKALEIILKIQKQKFFDETLLETFKTMNLLNISIEEIVEKYNKNKQE